MEHRRIDERSRAIPTLIADRVRRDPSYLEFAKANLARWRRIGSQVEGTDEEWDSLLNGDFESLLALLVDDGERATRLRQSSPFVGEPFLSADERAEIFRRFRESLPA